MTLGELRAAASARSPGGGAPTKYMLLTLERDSLPRGEAVRLTPQGGPLGRICCVGERDGGGFYVVARFEAAGIVDFCDRRARQ